MCDCELEPGREFQVIVAVSLHKPKSELEWWRGQVRMQLLFEPDNATWFTDYLACQSWEHRHRVTKHWIVDLTPWLRILINQHKTVVELYGVLNEDLMFLRYVVGQLRWILLTSLLIRKWSRSHLNQQINPKKPVITNRSNWNSRSNDALKRKSSMYLLKLQTLLMQ